MSKARYHLTGPEASAHKSQVYEKRCGVCVHRIYDGWAFGQPILRCGKGLRWPKRGVCRGFELEVDDDDQ